MLDEIQRRFPDLGVRSLAFRLGNADGSDRDLGRKDAARVAPPPETAGAAAGASGALGAVGATIEPEIGTKPAAPATTATSVPPFAPAPAASSPLPGEIRDMFEKIRKNIRR
jgi:hypothetical protein